MDVSLSVRVAPGESGVLETHTWKLKEAKTTNQVLEFVRDKIKPFLSQQTELTVEVEEDEGRGKIEKNIDDVPKEDIRKQKLTRGPPGEEYGNPDEDEDEEVNKVFRKKSKKAADEITPAEVKKRAKGGKKRARK